MGSTDFIKVYPQVSFWQYGRNKAEQYGFVLCDGEHTCDTVLAEVEYFSSRMVDGGMLVIDDAHLLETDGEYREKLQPFLDECELVEDQLFWSKP